MPANEAPKKALAWRRAARMRSVHRAGGSSSGTTSFPNILPSFLPLSAWDHVCVMLCGGVPQIGPGRAGAAAPSLLEQGIPWMHGTGHPMDAWAVPAAELMLGVLSPQKKAPLESKSQEKYKKGEREWHELQTTPRAGGAPLLLPANPCRAFGAAKGCVLPQGCMDVGLGGLLQSCLLSRLRLQPLLHAAERMGAMGRRRWERLGHPAGHLQEQMLLAEQTPSAFDPYKLQKLYWCIWSRISLVSLRTGPDPAAISPDPAASALGWLWVHWGVTGTYLQGCHPTLAALPISPQSCCASKGLETQPTS